MDFTLTAEQEEFRRVARDFAVTHLAPVASALDEAQQFPHDNIQKMARLGFLGLTVPEEYGGVQADALSCAIVLEEISKVCASTGVIMAVHNGVVCAPLVTFGTPEQKERYLPQLATGKILGAFALTEPNSGSDAAALVSMAEDRGDHYAINGRKCFITNGEICGLALVLARTERSQKHHGITAFLIEKGWPGFRVGKKENKLGLRASDTCELIFEDCPVPKSAVLGAPGQGFAIAMTTLESSRIGIAAQALGIAQGAFDAAVAYAEQRKQFDKPLASFQAIQWMIADMATEIEAARLLVYKAAVIKETTGKPGSWSSMAKLYASETAARVTAKAVQIHGGYGCIKDFPVERFYRDAKITEIYEGTSEVQRMVIANAYLHLAKIDR